MIAQHANLDANLDHASPERHAALGRHPDHLAEELLTLASHEIMTPLTSLKLQVQTMKRMSERGPEAIPPWAAGMLAVFDRQVDRLAHLCDDLLQATKIEAGQLSPVPEDVDLAGLVRDVVARFAAQRPSGGAITVEADGQVIGRWDRFLLEHLAFHLVKNAVLYGGAEPIAIEVRAADDEAQLVVRDHGMGIHAEDQDRIFGCFERAVPVENFGGLGLGLFIARAIAEAHGGAIRVESEPRRGATFIVDLPRAPAGCSDPR